jgi:hypothetical protein
MRGQASKLEQLVNFTTAKWLISFVEKLLNYVSDMFGD